MYRLSRISNMVSITYWTLFSYSNTNLPIWCNQHVVVTNIQDQNPIIVITYEFPRYSNLTYASSYWGIMLYYICGIYTLFLISIRAASGSFRDATFQLINLPIGQTSAFLNTYLIEFAQENYLMFCAKRCAWTTSCFSFFYKKEATSCSLHRYDFQISSGNTIEKEWRYYVTKGKMRIDRLSTFYLWNNKEKYFSDDLLLQLLQ